MNRLDSLERGLKVGTLIIVSFLLGSLLGLVHHADSWVQELHRDTHRNLVVIGAAATDLQKTLALERQSATAQLADADAAAKGLAATSTTAQQFLAHTDASLNGAGGVLPELAGAVHEQNAQLVALERQAAVDLAALQTSAESLNQVLASAATATANAAALSADPAIRQALERFNAALDKTNDTLLHVDAIAASGDRDAQMLETRLRQALKPASLAKQIFTRALGLAGPAAQIATAAQHK